MCLSSIVPLGWALLCKSTAHPAALAPGVEGGMWLGGEDRGWSVFIMKGWGKDAGRMGKIWPVRQEDFSPGKYTIHISWQLMQTDSVLANLQPVCGRKFFSKDDSIVSIHFTTGSWTAPHSSSPATPPALLLHLPCCSNLPCYYTSCTITAPNCTKEITKINFRSLLPDPGGFSAPLKKISYLLGSSFHSQQDLSF